MLSEIYIRTYDLVKKLLSFEKEHLDVVCLSITDPDDDPEYGGPASLWIQGVNSADPGIAPEESIESDESLADLF